MKKFLLATISLFLLAPCFAQRDSLKAKQMQHNKEVYKELNLSQEQKEKMKSIREDAKTKREAIVNNKALTKEDQRKQLEALRTSTNNSINNILTPAQQVQFKEIQQSNKKQFKKEVVKNKGLYKDINLTQEQKDKIKSIREDAKKKHESIISNASLTKDQQKNQLQELRNTTDNNLNNVLTAEQKSQLQKNKDLYNTKELNR